MHKDYKRGLLFFARLHTLLNEAVDKEIDNRIKDSTSFLASEIERAGAFMKKEKQLRTFKGTNYDKYVESVQKEAETIALLQEFKFRLLNEVVKLEKEYAVNQIIDEDDNIRDDEKEAEWLKEMAKDSPEFRAKHTPKNLSEKPNSEHSNYYEDFSKVLNELHDDDRGC
jgi:hypothetical protein